MPQPLLRDPDVFPSDEVIFAHLGKARRLWEQVMDRLPQVCPGGESQWRYYADGKRWLMKVSFRKKTLCWVSVDETMRMHACACGYGLNEVPS